MAAGVNICTRRRLYIKAADLFCLGQQAKADEPAFSLVLAATAAGFGLARRQNLWWLRSLLPARNCSGATYLGHCANAALP